MNAGLIDQRVTIERQVDTQDEYGQRLDQWLTIVTAWAAVEPLQGREYLAAVALVSEVSTRIRLRYRPGITSADRVNHNGRIYNIVSTIDVHSSRRELVLMCRG